MPSIGYAPTSRSSGDAGANSIFLSQFTAPQNSTATAFLLDGNNGASGISIKAVIYDASHAALLASGSIVTTIASGYNRLPLTAGLSLTAGTVYYVGYVCSASCTVGLQSSAGPGGWFVGGGQSVASPANPLVGGSSNGNTLMSAVELDATGLPGFGWGPDFASGVTRTTSNTVATFSAAANLGVRGVVTQVGGTGKFYAEIDIGGTINSGVAVGIASVNWGVTQGIPAATIAPAYAAFFYQNGVRTSGATLGVGAYASGDTIGIAYDCVNHLIWWNKNNGSWYGAGLPLGDPVAGTQGFTFNASTWPLTVAGMTATGTAAAFTLRDTAGALKYTPPSGYAPWSSATFPVVATSQARAMVLA